MKKKYISPSIFVVKADAETLLAASPSTDHFIPDGPGYGGDEDEDMEQC